jgi:hypothetical protein
MPLSEHDLFGDFDDSELDMGSDNSEAEITCSVTVLSRAGEELWRSHFPYGTDGQDIKEAVSKAIGVPVSDFVLFDRGAFRLVQRGVSLTSDVTVSIGPIPRGG